MKTLAFLLLSAAVALGMPFPPQGAQKPIPALADLSPLLIDVLPVQGHVVAGDPAPQVRLDSKQQSQSVVGLEVKVKPEGAEVQQGEEKTEVNAEVKAQPKAKLDQELKADLEVKVEPEVKPEAEAKVEQELLADAWVKVEPEVEGEAEEKVQPKVEDEPDFKVDPEVMAQPEANMVHEPELKDMKSDEEQEDQRAQEELQVQMNLEEEADTPEQEVEERHIDMEGKSEMMGEPIMEQEPEDDNNLFEELNGSQLSQVEMSMMAAFQREDPVNQPLTEEEELMKKTVLDEEPTNQEFVERHIDMEGKYEMMGEPSEEEPNDSELSGTEKLMRATFQNEEPLMESLTKGEEPVMYLQSEMTEEEALSPLDNIGQQFNPYYPYEEAGVGVMEEPGSEFAGAEELPEDNAMLPYEEEPMMMYGGVLNDVAP